VYQRCLQQQQQQQQQQQAHRLVQCVAASLPCHCQLQQYWVMLLLQLALLILQLLLCMLFLQSLSTQQLLLHCYQQHLL
jgi:hypothetical protein